MQYFVVFVDSFATAPSHLGDCVVCGTGNIGPRWNRWGEKQKLHAFPNRTLLRDCVPK